MEFWFQPITNNLFWHCGDFWMVCLWHLIHLSQSSQEWTYVTGGFFLCFKMDILWGYGLLYNMSNGHYLSIYLFFVINLRKGSFFIFLSWHWKIGISLLSICVLWYYYFDQFTILFDLVSWANSDHQSLFSVYSQNFCDIMESQVFK